MAKEKESRKLIAALLASVTMLGLVFFEDWKGVHVAGIALLWGIYWVLYIRLLQIDRKLFGKEK